MSTHPFLGRYDDDQQSQPDVRDSADDSQGDSLAWPNLNPRTINKLTKSDSGN